MDKLFPIDIVNLLVEYCSDIHPCKKEIKKSRDIYMDSKNLPHHTHLTSYDNHIRHFQVEYIQEEKVLKILRSEEDTGIVFFTIMSKDEEGNCYSKLVIKADCICGKVQSCICGDLD